MTLAKESVLTINGGSSSIKFALYQIGEPPVRKLVGKIDRIGASGTNLTFNDTLRGQQGSLGIEAADHGSAANFLIDWLEQQVGITHVRAVGHRVVRDGTSSQSLFLRHCWMNCRISSYDPEHLPLEIALIGHSANAIPPCLRWRALTPRFITPCRALPACCRFRDVTGRRAFAVMASTVCLMNSSWRNSHASATRRQRDA